MKLHPTLVAILAFSAPAAAETTAVLQKDVEGRSQILLMNSMPDGREVMLMASCRSSEPERITGLVDLGAGAKWDPVGEEVTFTLDGLSIGREMMTNQHFLILPGEEGNDTFRAILEADEVTVTGPENVSASFSLANVKRHIEAFKPLCAS
ncbi:hypothetical protein [Phyllobacterium sp. K27]